MLLEEEKEKGEDSITFGDLRRSFDDIKVLITELDLMRSKQPDINQAIGDIVQVYNDSSMLNLKSNRGYYYEAN
tara:strand:- start:63 stop:284 length:222 start_codon:yes stop_codon:yes gene_type:complete